MLQKLHIRNYAIIQNLEITFSKNLNIITGETGAGKSILIGALNLILGERADSAVLQDKEQKCIVEAMFSTVGNSAVQQFVSKYDLDGIDEIFVRREIAANGKSRSFINDTPVNLSQLKELAIHLVDLHQQFDTLSLGEETFQRNVLDALAENALLLHNLQELFGKYSASNKELEALQLQQTNANKEADYHRFLFEELETLSLKEGELEQLDAELKLLSNAENIKQHIGGVYFELAESEQPVLLQLKSLQQKLYSLNEYHPGIADLNQRINSSLLELQDIADELEHINNSILYDAERIQIVNDRLSAGYKLLKKHNVTTTAELLNVQQELSNKLEALVNMSSDIDRLQQLANKYYDEALGIAKKISTNRSSQVKSFVQNTDALLSQVGMPNAHIRVKIENANLSATGVDAISFLFDANKSNRFEPLHKVASGGELSRLMLAIKSLVAQQLQMPTLIFDEIDTGISGEAAKQVGIIMKQLAANHQIISITHQPQIAAKADAHYYVYKQIVNDKVETNIRPLNNDERIVNIAQMLSGEKPTAAALQNAREMVGN
ncbi:MAG TPA: DNA repair protein RecN [Ferruginibacter sp.]|nr:DNA repair protein RecN [Ferruginibacter sp.]